MVSQIITGPGADTVTYTWDEQQRLITITNDAGTISSIYDTTHNRVVRIDPDGTRTLYLGNTEIRWSASTNTLQAARRYGQTRREFNGDVTHYAVNHHGTLAAATSNNPADEPVRLRTMPYGVPRILPNGARDIDDRNYLGAPDDPDTPTVYLNHRHYAPAIGVFASTDPLLVSGQPETLNPYLYSYGRPTRLHDLSGLKPDDPALEEAFFRAQPERMRRLNRIQRELEDNLSTQRFQQDVSSRINDCAEGLRTASCSLNEWATYDDPYWAAVAKVAYHVLGLGIRSGLVHEDEYGWLQPAYCGGAEACMPGFGDDLGSHLTGVDDPSIEMAFIMGMAAGWLPPGNYAAFGSANPAGVLADDWLYLPGLPASAPVPLGLGSTGRAIPRNLTEQLAMTSVRSAPGGIPLPMAMGDPRWPAAMGWVKMGQYVGGVEIHYVRNTITGAVDDFKFGTP